MSHNDVWAWCRIVVTVNWKGFEGKDSLGCCSYKDLDDFESDGYYNDMVFEALDELNCNITDYYIKLTERYNEKTKG